ncbi:MAG: VanZ family protein [Deltaproteobacteria bacterium]|nr:VanZ family protein [Deltaproteobacteria bacterium]
MAIERKRFSWQVVWGYWIPLLSYMALIFYLSSQPLEELKLPEIWNIDKLLHVVEYGLLGFLWFRALKVSFESTTNLYWLAFVLTLLYGISDEIHQIFVPNRSSSIFDAIADGIGGWLGVWLYRRLNI